MSDNIKSFTELIQFKGVFVLYLVVACNFLANTFGCKTQELLKNNMYIKHIVGLMTLFLFVTLGSASNTDDENIFFKKFGASVLLYIVFLMSTRTKGIYLNIFLSLIGANFLINAYIDSLDKEKFKERIEKLKMYGKWCNRFAIIILVIGVIMYYNEKKKEYNNDFNLGTFVLGNVVCKNDPK